MKPYRCLNLLLLILCLISYLNGEARKDTTFNDGPYLWYDLFGRPVIRTIRSGKVQVESAIQVRPADAPAFGVSLHTFTIPPSVYPEAQKLLVVSDVEGQFTGFRRLLFAAGVIDNRYNWTFGKGQLVICGDLFDRGSEVTEILWLLYGLEQKAAKSGGYVHLIMGNHDLMNLTGDYRYVNQKYFHSAKLLGVGYPELYASRTELGRWLRSKNAVEKIGSGIFVHAGLSPELAALNLTIQAINDSCRKYLDTPKLFRTALAQTLYGRTGPYWYRGYFMSPRLEAATLQQVLESFGATQIIVGHTIVKGNIQFYYGGKVLGIDADVHSGDHQAAFLENGIWYQFNIKEAKQSLIYEARNDQFKDEDIL